MRTYNFRKDGVEFSISTVEKSKHYKRNMKAER
jgi:hypothetical protein